ncbi:phosphatase PAP2 family protein [Cobetia marina]|jgi:undecaprenyl-diphosphatase|uniref:undecaprenyl-diphosphate phosphatase n=1 Tax=Cobetia marina TaxID=28258 RepID=A0ABU9GF72_COBMA|nr:MULTISPECIES: phosphatase PAP2 family protein [Cobetia]AOM01776.1 phosphatase PAP2 family protein [Cobetia marina]MDA5562283.1 phosphatase PAP2 family protein [Cobetia sp. MMG027]MDH2290236.1 phosphatase PAP2 family protein [Cobetia sp. 10Alg 146]MDH2375070.1 phosphatase PAP2 family protein [Cobetia sp. 3AK]MDN2655340.1 phosphatase PAP2 family protein [Cobetia sp. 14N.309.X.WAT.E.A4]
MHDRSLPVFERLDLLEWRLCRQVARLALYRPILTLFRVVSRLGDWPVWLLLTLSLPFHHVQGGWLMLEFGLAAGAGALLYRALKTRLCRERPFITFTTIQCTMPPLDRYSFPSGHTLHAVLFASLTAQQLPELAILVTPLAMLIALSRVILGLHYVSDVLAGALLGLGLAEVAILSLESLTGL